VLDILAEPRFAALFDGDALTEAPITATLPDGLVVAGTVDRLLVGADRIMLVDYKTGRRAPAAVAEVPDYHLRQMAAYAAALRVIFPDRRVEAALLYTSGPSLLVLPPELLDRHKPGLPATEQS
jgi:ATP-dependent helicase/nuclease subunit A